MIIKTYQLDKLKKNLSNYYLLYGENEGLKTQTINNILSSESKNNISRYEESEIINNFDNFITQITNKSQTTIPKSQIRSKDNRLEF